MAQCIFERSLHGHRVGADFTLIDDRFFVGKDEFDRIFYREDVARQAGIAVIHHRGKGGGFASSGSAHHQNQAALFHDHVGQPCGHIERFKCWNIGGDVANHAGIGAALFHGRDTEVAHAVNRMCHVQFMGFFQLFNAGGRQHFSQQAFDCVGGQWLVVDWHGLAVDFDRGWSKGRQVHIRSLFLGHQLQDAFHHAHCVLLQIFNKMRKCY